MGFMPKNHDRKKWVLSKVLCHNVWVLVRSMHERRPGLGLVVYFST